MRIDLDQFTVEGDFKSVRQPTLPLKVKFVI